MSDVVVTNVVQETIGPGFIGTFPHRDYQNLRTILCSPRARFYDMFEVKDNRLGPMPRTIAHTA